MTQDLFVQRRRAAVWRRLLRYLLGIVLVGLAAGAGWAVWFSDLLTVEHVRVEGVTTLTSASVRDQADVPIGLQLARIDADGIATRVARMERVDQVHVGRRWPRTVRIAVVERKPIAWVMSAGHIRQVDHDGIDFRTLAAKPSATGAKRLIEIRVQTEDPLRRQQAVQGAAQVVTFVRGEAPDVWRDVRYVTVASKDSIRLELTSDRSVVWGSADEAKKKLRVLRALLPISAERYDVSAPEQPTTWSHQKKN